jgi:hypothetical protein
MENMKRYCDDKILMGLIAERKSELNPYTPFAERLSSIYRKLEKKVNPEGNISHDPVAYMLQRLIEKVKRVNEIQHSGGRVKAEDWSELYQLTNEASALLDEIK